MAFEFSQTFSYTGQPTTWEKPVNVRYANIRIKGAGGAGSQYAGGGGGGYVFAQFQYLNQYVPQTVYINVGGGGKTLAPYAGGISPGGNDPSYNYGGNGTVTLAGLASAGGGGMSSVISYDKYDNRVINVIAGGGGGGGTTSSAVGGIGGRGTGGANGGVVGTSGGGVGGGPGGNSNKIGNGGYGGLVGSVNGYDYEFLQPTDVSYNGGGGGSGGSFAGGGGGAGYGGGAGGRVGGGGGGGSFGNGVINAYTGFGNNGGIINSNGSNGEITIYWTTKQFLESPIVNMYMLNPQHTNQSTYTGPARDPSAIDWLVTPTLANPYPIVVNFDNDICFVSGNGILYMYNHDKTLLWSSTCSTAGYRFIGTPAISIDGTIYVSTVKTTPGASVGYLYAIIDINNVPLIKWTLEVNGNPTIAPILDASNNIYLGTSAGTIYSITDQFSLGVKNWQYDISYNPTVRESAVAMDVARSRLCVTSSDVVTNISRLTVLDMSTNTLPTRTRWSVDISGILSNPTIEGNRFVYTAANNGKVYGYDISANTPTPLWAPVDISDTNISSIAIGPANNLYMTSNTAINIIDTLNGVFEWKYILPDTLPVTAGSALLYNSTPVIDASNNVFFGTFNNYIYAIDGIEHSINWRYQANGAITSAPIIGKDNNIWFGTNNGRIYNLSGSIPSIPINTQIVAMYMLNPQHTGKSIYQNNIFSPSNYWQYPLFNTANLYVLPSFAMDVSNALYIGSGDGYLHSINTVTNPGARNWQLQLPVITNSGIDAPNAIYTTPMISPYNIIYIGSNGGILYAVNRDGTINWAYNTNTGGPLQSSPIISSRNIIYFASGSNMYAIRDGITFPYNDWVQPYSTDGAIYSSPALSTDEMTVYFGSTDGYIYAVNTLFGTLKWRFSTNDGVPLIHPIYSSPAVDASDNIIIGNGSYMNGVLYSLSPTNGAKNWDFSYNQPIGPYYNTVAINGNTIYLSSIAYLFAINRVTGVAKWTYNQYNIIPYVYYSTLTIDTTGRLFFTAISALTLDCDLFCVTDTGTSFNTLWQQTIGTNYRLSQPTIDSNGIIYMNSTDNNIYAVR